MNFGERDHRRGAESAGSGGAVGAIVMATTTAVHSIPSWFGCNGAASEKPMIGSTQRTPEG